MDTKDLMQAIATGFMQAALQPQTTLSGVDQDGRAQWQSEPSPLYTVLTQLSDALWKDELFQRIVKEEIVLPANIAKLAQALIDTLSKKAVFSQAYSYRGERYQTDPMLLEVMRDALQAQLREHPELLADRIDAEMLKNCTIEVRLIPKEIKP